MIEYEIQAEASEPLSSSQFYFWCREFKNREKVFFVIITEEEIDPLQKIVIRNYENLHFKVDDIIIILNGIVNQGHWHKEDIPDLVFELLEVDLNFQPYGKEEIEDRFTALMNE